MQIDEVDALLGLDGLRNRLDVEEQILVQGLAAVGHVDGVPVVLIDIAGLRRHQLADQVRAGLGGDEVGGVDRVGDHQHFRLLELARDQVVALAVLLIAAGLIAERLQGVEVAVERAAVHLNAVFPAQKIQDLLLPENVVGVGIRLQNPQQCEDIVLFLCHKCTF